MHEGKRAVRIQRSVDQRYRDGLMALAKENGGRTAIWHILNSLTNGPSRGGYAEAAKYFGSEFDTKLKLTAPIVEACEVSMPGFAHWLVATGFGNDKSMIKGFVAWAEFTTGKGKVMTGIGDWAKERARQ